MLKGGTHMKPLVPCVFATDDKFAPYCGASIASLIANADPDRQYALYVFYDVLSQDSIDKLNSMSTSNVSVECRCITPIMEKDRHLLFVHKRQTLATYFRFYTAEELPQYDKVLYLDSDIAILSDIGELYDIDIGDNLLGGAVIYRDRENERKLKEKYLMDLMGVTPDKYVNAGILAMNLKAFREDGTKEKCLKYLSDRFALRKSELREELIKEKCPADQLDATIEERFPDYLKDHPVLQWMDQDVLNAVCKGRIHFLPNGWNTSQFYYEEDYLAGEDVSDTHLIHYIDRIKPWLVDFRPSHLHFYKYAQLCPYADELNAMFLEINKNRATRPGKADVKVSLSEDNVSEGRRYLLQMAKQGKLGPKFLLKCGIKWFKGKLSRLMKK